MTLAETRPTFSHRRRQFSATVAALLTLPTLSSAQAAQWEFFERRAREFSRLRRVADTIAIEFGGKRVATSSWGRLSEADQAVVRQAQVPPLGAGDEPPYPSAGLTPIIERLHRVRGPVNMPLRLHFTINDVGDIEGMATDVPVPGPFLNELLQQLVSSGFKPGACGSETCARRLTLDIVYLGG